MKFSTTPPAHSRPSVRRPATLRLVPQAGALIALALLAACSGGDGDDSVGAPNEAPTLSVQSSRADMVTGGDALVQFDYPTTVQGALRVTVNGTDVSASVHETSDGHRQALITGLTDGDNALVATVGGGAPALLTLKNHPITGPVLSGPHLTPYECRTVESGLGAALDENCSAARQISWYYRTTGNVWASLTDPTGPRPGDLATTTTNTGATVPYIVRVDSGTINRSVYRIAILDDPTTATADPAAWRPGTGWNRKLSVFFDGGAGTRYSQGSNIVTAALNDNFLSRGFAYVISTELANRQRANGVLQGETLMMIKEYFIERYGKPTWTVGTGSSGGGIQQLVITQIDPGLLDGIMPGRLFNDSTSTHITDCGLLEHFYATADPAVWTAAKRAAVEGFTAGTCRAWAQSYVPIFQATNQPGCDIRDSTKIYHPIYNPRGARCTPQDVNVNIVGRDPVTGYARKPNDNVGLQYGLLGLKDGTLSTEDFLQINEQVGGNDVDGNFVSNRSAGDEFAIRAVYESGLVNTASGGLATVPILSLRNYLDDRGDIHTHERDLAFRARLQKGVGRTDHHVAWVYPGTGDRTAEALDVMDDWLDALVADPAPLTTAKVVSHKPTAAVDACFAADGTKIAETLGSTGTCSALYPVHSEPRLQAGAPVANDVMKCRLRNIDFADYAPATFTAPQQARLRAVFPTGVCDFSVPGIQQLPMKGTYQKF